MRVLIVGCGYVGLCAGALLARQGRQVFGLRRSSIGEATLREAGITPILADITQAEDLARIRQDFDVVVNCAAPNRGSPSNYQQTYYQGTSHLLSWLQKASPKVYIYTSSSGVYSENEGGWVDETGAVGPATETGRILLDTENLLMDAVKQSGFPAVILRVAGIYGPGRGYYLQSYLKQEARIEGSGDRYLNMAHRDDVAGAIIAAIERGRAGALYNVVDDEPVQQIELYRWLAEKTGFGLPPMVEEVAGLVTRRGVTNKRLSNRKLKNELGYTFQFPTFREGMGPELPSPT